MTDLIDYHSVVKSMESLRAQKEKKETFTDPND